MPKAVLLYAFPFTFVLMWFAILSTNVNNYIPHQIVFAPKASATVSNFFYILTSQCQDLKHECKRPNLFFAFIYIRTAQHQHLQHECK